MRCSSLQMCKQCRKLQKCLLMQAQTPMPLNSCVSCLSSAQPHIIVDVYVLHIQSETTFQILELLYRFQLRSTCFFPRENKPVKLSGKMNLRRIQRFVNLSKKTILCVSALKSTRTQPCNQIQIHFTWLPFKNTSKSALTHVHKQICHMCVSWADAIAREHAQTGAKPLRLWEYLCVSVCHF